jgi:hypothetical protein
MGEGTYKDGKIISWTFWNEDGSVRKKPFDWKKFIEKIF